MSFLWLRPSQEPLFPSPDQLTPLEDGLVALGGVLSPRAILEAYRKGIFPWTGEHPIPWYSPNPRLILAPGELHVTRSLRQRRRNGGFEIGADQRFGAIMSMCATTPRHGQDGTWITPNMVSAWTQLHRQGYAHSVEVTRDGELVGGLYGLALGGAFFGESMASREPDTSKLALWWLCERLEALGFAFIDCQQETPHLKRMGAAPVSRAEYLRRLDAALLHPQTWRVGDPS